MHGYRKLLLGAAAAALAITALGAPAAAADTKGTLAVVNGVPGKKVDVCVAGKELSSGLAYGGVVRKNVISTGTKMLKFYNKDPRTCRGQLLGSKTLNISAGTDLTIVVTKNAPKVVVFDNFSPLDMGEIPPRGVAYSSSLISFNHAAEIPINWIHKPYLPSNGEFPWSPAANAVWTKGDHFASNSAVTDWYFQERVTEPESSDVLASRTAYMKPSRRYEWIFVGSNPVNARMVLIDRGVSQPSA